MSKVDFTKSNTIVFVSFESEFAPCGGLTAVMRMLPRKLALMYPQKKVVLITPYFKYIKNTLFASQSDRFQLFEENTIEFNNKKEKFSIYSYPSNPQDVITEPMNFSIYLIRSEHFFNAPINPYINNNDEYNSKLFIDAVFFSSCVPKVLSIIPRPSPFLLNLQDWETSIVAKLLTDDSKRTNNLDFESSCVLTLHNPYDHPLSISDSDSMVSIDVLIDITKPLPGQYTILQYSLPYVEKISTVSSHFAYELISDPLHTQAFAPHLQSLLKEKSIIGIENGNFIQSQLPEKLRTIDSVKKFKDEQRKKFVSIIQSPQGQEMLKHAWGNADFPEDIPIFHIFGRDDPRQKGYDVATAIIEQLLDKHGKNYARFVFTPIPGRDGIAALNYIHDLTIQHPQSVLAFPFKMDKGYIELQKASTYILMPSIYEPFGAANEGYSSGVPVVARATGGLLQQVDPLNFSTLPEEIQKKVLKYHGKVRNPTGFLYKEQDGIDYASDWKILVESTYLQENPIGNPLRARNHLDLFKNMVKAGKEAIEEAIQLYQNDSEQYCLLILNGKEKLKDFSWETSINKYVSSLYSL